jgi:carboxymethylenebutenolidase
VAAPPLDGPRPADKIRTMKPAAKTKSLVVFLVCSALTCAVSHGQAIPPAEAGAKAALERSPRHGEFVDVKVPGMQVPLKTFVVYPERKDKAPVVIVIHEIFGLSDWVRSVADQLAADGFIAIAPDLLSGRGPGGGGTESIQGEKVRDLVRGLKPDEVVARLNAVRDYGMKLPAASGKTATIGFCWGGMMSFHYATAQPGLNAAVVYYGTSPDNDGAYANVKAPVLGMYGSDDARVNATSPKAKEQMGKLQKQYDARVYEGAGHGFLRAQDGREANLKAAKEAWPATVTFLREKTK